MGAFHGTFLLADIFGERLKVEGGKIGEGRDTKEARIAIVMSEKEKPHLVVRTGAH